MAQAPAAELGRRENHLNLQQLFHPVHFIQQCPMSQINESHETPCLEALHTRNGRASPTQTIITAPKIVRPAWRTNVRETTLCTDRRTPFPVLMSRWKTSYFMVRQKMAWSIFAWSGKLFVPFFNFHLLPLAKCLACSCTFFLSSPR